MDALIQLPLEQEGLGILRSTERALYASSRFSLI